MIARYVTWVLIALCPLLLVATAALWLAGTPVRDAESLVAMLAFAGVGAVLVVRRPQNAVGWLCLAMALTGVSSFSARAYATHTLVTAPGSLPGGAVAAWWAGWILTPVFLILTNFLPLLFPTGQPPSARWRPLLWASFAGLVVFSLSAGLAPGPLAGAREFEN
ncbi:MAG: hypothetical protein M3Q61_06785, partial [Chloroflexota bacterium]|nr:hypothetical protein [Chloroflexota bacterium]